MRGKKEGEGEEGGGGEKEWREGGSGERGVCKDNPSTLHAIH